MDAVKNIQDIFGGASNDETTPTHDPDEYTVYAQCQVCFDWTMIVGSPAVHGEYTRGRVCEHCGGNFDPTSVISKRTYNPVNAKRRRPKGVKKK